LNFFIFVVVVAVKKQNKTKKNIKHCRLGCGGYAPFTFEGNAAASRYLGLYYSYIFEHWYSYDICEGTEDYIFQNILNPNSAYNVSKGYKIRIEELMEREYQLVTRWIEYKTIRDRKARYLKTFQELFDYVKMRTENWYSQVKLYLIPSPKQIVK
jgi:hypothetical protein